VSNRDGGDEGLGQRPTELANRKPVFRLYVSGATPKSTQAIVSVKRVLESMCGGDYELRVVDIYQEREKVNRAQVSAVPMLVREQPLPVLRMIGDFSSPGRIRSMLSAASPSEDVCEQDGKRNQE